MTESTCVQCGSAYTKTHGMQKYCPEHRGREADRQRETVERTCVTCGDSWLTRRANAKYCSDECKGRRYAETMPTKCALPPAHPVTLAIADIKAQAARLAAERRVLRALSKYAWRTARDCRICGATFTPLHTPTMLTCGVACQRAIGRRDKRVRSRKIQSVYVEPVHWRIVARRDGDACYLCGFSVDPTDHEWRIGSDGRKTFITGLEYPTVDHVVALANGGEHSLNNARLAHAYCNSIKSDTPLSLVA